MANRSPRQQNIRRLGKVAENIAKLALELEAIAAIYQEAKPPVTFWLLSTKEILDESAVIVDNIRKEI